MDECKSCLCVRGQVQCAQELCSPVASSCPANMKLRTVPGSCCPRCVPSECNNWLVGRTRPILTIRTCAVTEFSTFQWTACARCSATRITGRTTASFSVFKDRANICWARTARAGRLASGWPTTRGTRKIRPGRKPFRWGYLFYSNDTVAPLFMNFFFFQFSQIVRSTPLHSSCCSST